MAVTNEQVASYLASNPGLSDADIAAAMNQFKVTPAQMAQVTGLDAGAVQSRYDAATTGASQQATVDPIEQLYTQYAGRGSDPGGLDYWRNQFGADVDANEAAIFQRAVAENVAKGIESTATGTNYNPYFAANPDVAAEYMRNTQGMTPEQFAQTHYTKFGVNEGRAAPGGALTQAAQTTTGQDPLTLTYHTGQVYKGDELLSLAKELAGATSAGALQGGVYGEVGGNIGFAAEEAQKLFGDKTTAVSQVFLDAAAQLLNKGVTSLSQLKYGDITGQANVMPVYSEDGRITGYRAYYGNDGEGNYTFSRDLTPEEAAQVKTREVSDGEGTYTTYEPISTVVGKGIVGPDGKTVSDTSQLHIGSTYTGPGGTFYTLTIDPDTGKPAFSTFGQSSSDLGSIAPLLTIAQFVPGLAPFAAAANAAIALDQGNKIGALTSLFGIPGVGNLLPAGVTSALQTVNRVSNLKSAAERGDLLGLINAGVNLTNTGGTQIGDTGFTIGDALNTVDFANAVRSGDPDAITRAMSMVISANRSAGGDGGGITNRIYDDAIVQAGAEAFISAKSAGATDDEAYDAANAVTGVQINPIDAGGPNLSTTTTYDPRAATVDTNFGDLQGAIETNAMNDAVRADKLNAISQTPRFNDAYRQARELLGPNQTFTWNGKQYSTATAQERPDLSAPAIQPATDQSAAETARLASKNAELATSSKVESTGFFRNLYNDLNSRLKLQGEGAVEYLKNNPNSPITNSVSTALEAAGQLSKNIIGGTALFFDNKPVADAVVKSGDALIKLGQSVGTGPQDTKNWNDTINLVDKAQGWEKLGVVAGRILDGTSGLGRQVELELRQELPALFLGGGSVKGILVASGLVDTADTGGNAVLDAYQEDIDKGGNHKSALAAGRKAGVAAAGTEAVIQATLGKLGDLAAGKLDNLLAKGTTKIGSEGVVEGSQEAGASAAVDLALGNAIDVNKALTQGVAGAFVGKGTATATSGIDAAQTESISNNISTAVASGNPAAVNSAITGSITTAAESGADVDLSIASTVSTAVDAGADVNSVVAAATEAANNTGNDVLITSDDNVVTINNVTTNTNTTVDVASGVTTSVNNNTGITTVVDAKTNTTTTVNANTNTTTQVTTNANIQTTVVTDTDTNTQTTININTDTGEVIDEKETTIPDDWKPPVIDAPDVPPTVTPPTVTTPTTPAAPKLKPKLPDDERKGAGAVGLPVGMDVNPASLRSRETQKAIDPLARVKEIQAEFERDAMIQNVDPRLLQILQQRSDPQQQAQQFDNDIGALAKLLSGKPDAPSSNSSDYYSYGAEDSIDDILGGRAANYKEGGFVEPLKASGGSMALPLLVKSGGALGHYKGRENFKEGKHVAGEGDGQSDDIPAWLADGEFVFPADVVSALGNGSTKAGTDKLYEMMHNIRDRARSKGPKDLPPPALKSPLDYLKSSKRSTT